MFAGAGVLYQDVDPAGDGAVYRKTTPSGNTGWSELGAGGGGGGGSLIYARFRGPGDGSDLTEMDPGYHFNEEYFTTWALYEPPGVVTGPGFAVVDNDFVGSGTTVKAIQTPGPGMYLVHWHGSVYVRPYDGVEKQIGCRIGTMSTTDQYGFVDVRETIAGTSDHEQVVISASGIVWVQDTTNDLIFTSRGEMAGTAVDSMAHNDRQYLHIAQLAAV